MYANIPIKETKHILNSILTHNLVDQQTSTELLNKYEIITQQNYFTNDGEVYIQKDGLAMGHHPPASYQKFFYKISNTVTSPP
jgi:hypothetical protein